MPRYAALLRGVSPMNAKMPEFKRAFEKAGFTDVRTVASSGNVVFTARSASIASLQKKAEAAMLDHLGRSFVTIVRPVEALRAILATDPYKGFDLAPNEKRIITFLRDPSRSNIELPVQLRGARILVQKGGELFSSYLPDGHGPDFMVLIEKTFGKDVTTRTWESVTKIAR